MKYCIICRELKDDFKDEHVIPDSIGGYYHIYNVCKKCNSNLGEKVDTKLINHKFIEFQRHLLKLKGKKGHIPNPFEGTHQLENEPEQKVKLEYNNGVFQPYLLPKIKDDDLIENGFTIVIDKRDKDKAQQIIDKILSRHGIPKDKVKTESWIENESKPIIHIQQAIDIKDFKIGILKIAYEFAIDSIPEYYKDDMSIKIAKILKNCSIDKLNDIKFLGSGFDKDILKPLAPFFDFENVEKHYLILASLRNIGLICLVNLFNAFSIAILLSNNSQYLDNNFIVGINDIKMKSFTKKRFNELLASIYSSEYRFEYFFKTKEELDKFRHNQILPNFAFFRNNNKIPFFDINGDIVYSDIEDKLKQVHLIKIPKGDDINEVFTQIIIHDEELYIKVLPSGQLCQVISVQLESYKKRKI